ncbi:cupin domain-containing protein [Streptomyces sp. TE33382]
MDVLTQWLAVSGVHGTIGGCIEAGGDWGVRWDGAGDAVIYAVNAGTAWIEMPGRETVQLLTGDAFLVAAGTPHAVAAGPGTMPQPCQAQPQEGLAAVTLRLGAEPHTTKVMAARYSYDAGVTTQVLSMLPESVHLRSGAGATWCGDTLRLMAREFDESPPGAGFVLNRLVEVMLAHFLRVWIDDPDRRPGREFGSLLGALTDPVVRDTIALIHAQPSRAWTAETLAASVAVSRATLIRHFADVVGTTPSAYLHQWRMDLASQQLRGTGDSVETIAHAVGYTSVPAFTRAFARTHSRSPGSFRRTFAD